MSSNRITSAREALPFHLFMESEKDLKYLIIHIEDCFIEFLKRERFNSLDDFKRRLDIYV